MSGKSGRLVPDITECLLRQAQTQARPAGKQTTTLACLPCPVTRMTRLGQDLTRLQTSYSVPLEGET